MTKGSTNKSLCDIYGLKTNKKELLVLTSKKIIWQFIIWHQQDDHGYIKMWLCAAMLHGDYFKPW